VQPKLLTQVCSADGGMVLVVVDADGDVVASGPHTLDCALCLPMLAPPPFAAPQLPPPSPLAHALQPVRAAHIAAATAAPLSARAPPSLLAV